MTEPTGEEREVTTQHNYHVMWLETVICRHLGLRISIARKGCYWWAYNPVIGEHRVTDLLKKVG